MSEDEGKVTGRGGPGRGQGLKPMYDEPMIKKTASLSPEMIEFLGIGEGAAEKLRRLLDWSRDNPDKLLPALKHKRGSVLVKTSFAMTDAHWQRAVLLGGGKRIAGIRRVIHTAMELGDVSD